MEIKKKTAINTLQEQARRKKPIQAERRKYLAGEGVSYSVNDVKQMAADKEKRHVLFVDL